MNNRSIRIFLSSTFRDFGEERDQLVKRVFPALRARLKDRFVELVDVDLRWGITVEEAERGEVLPICLAEIDRSRPYFIGMLGERYGGPQCCQARSDRLWRVHKRENGSRRRHVIFVLDALNSLSDQQDLRWWPAFLPQGVSRGLAQWFACSDNLERLFEKVIGYFETPLPPRH